MAVQTAEQLIDGMAISSLDSMIAMSTTISKKQTATICLSWFENELENVKNEINEIVNENERKTAK